MSLRRIVTAYYLATPLFFLIDLFWHAPLRVAFIPGAPVRYTYYAFCFACGLVMWKRPGTVPVLGLSETAVNFTLLLLSILWPIYSAVDTIETGGIPQLLTPPQLMNALFSGGMLIVSFNAREAEVARAFGLSQKR